MILKLISQGLQRNYMEWSLFPNRHQLSTAAISTISSVAAVSLEAKPKRKKKKKDELNIVFVLAMNKTEPRPQNFGHLISMLNPLYYCILIIS